jgi:uncharacterized protein (DUF433 family)
MKIINHIVIQNGQAVIGRQRHVQVKRIARLHLGEGVSIKDLMAHFELSAAEVHAALAFYYDNRTALDSEYSTGVVLASTDALRSAGMQISEEAFQRLVNRCRSLPVAKGNYLVDDFIENLFITVLDFQMRVVTVDRALDYYRQHTRSYVNDLDTLKRLLNNYPDTQQGNLKAAQILWGYNHWTRATLLRRLIEYFEIRGVTSQAQLKQWATVATFEKDFKGQIKGMSLAVFNWLVMRQGVETIKPDVWIHRFITEVFGSSVSDEMAVELLQRVAKELGLKAYELDWRIWEHMTGRT